MFHFLLKYSSPDKFLYFIPLYTGPSAPVLPVNENRNSSVHDRLISDIRNKKYRGKSAAFDYDRSSVPEGLACDGIEVYECRDCNDTENSCSYLIIDRDTVLTCRCDSELTKEQFDVICRDIVLK